MPDFINSPTYFLRFTEASRRYSPHECLRTSIRPLDLMPFIEETLRQAKPIHLWAWLVPSLNPSKPPETRLGFTTAIHLKSELLTMGLAFLAEASSPQDYLRIRKLAFLSPRTIKLLTRRN